MPGHHHRDLDSCIILTVLFCFLTLCWFRYSSVRTFSLLISSPLPPAFLPVCSSVIDSCVGLIYLYPFEVVDTSTTAWTVIAHYFCFWQSHHLLLLPGLVGVFCLLACFFLFPMCLTQVYIRIGLDCTEVIHCTFSIADMALLPNSLCGNNKARLFWECYRSVR